MLMEPFVVSTHRMLVASHPVAILLRPHFEGTVSSVGLGQIVVVRRLTF